MNTPNLTLVGYPCGCSRRVDLSRRGHNYCPTHRRYYSEHQLIENPTPISELETAEPSRLPVKVVMKDGTVVDMF